MIKRDIVFILGAGASCPYGFPDGARLTQMIAELMPTTHNQDTAFSQLFFDLFQNQNGFTIDRLIDFRNALTHSGHATIDSFLYTHRSQLAWPEIGKLAVAHILLPLEFSYDASRGAREVRRLANRDQDWMSFLFQHMLSGCLDTVDDFVNNNHAAFVTFNYDRNLEHFFWWRLTKTYGISEQLAWEKMKALKIVHVYGSLGEFNPRRPKLSDAALTPTEFRDAANSIRLMYEDRQSDPGAQRAMELISSAKTICFLGFGFDPDNIARIELTQRGVGKLTGATRYQVANGDWERAKSAMRPVDFNIPGASPNWDSLKFLQETDLIS